MCEENRIPYEGCQTQSATSLSVCGIINIETAAHAALTGEHLYIVLLYSFTHLYRLSLQVFSSPNSVCTN